MTKTTVLGLVLSLAAAPAFADGPSSEEKAGVGVGVVVGAAVGGPLGAIVGAAFGAKIGDEFNEREGELNSLTASLNGSKSEISSLNAELRHAQELARPELLALLQAGIEMDLLFRTDEHVLSDQTGDRLNQLATSLAANPDIRIHLDGYADERGDEIYNQGLSVRRVEHVRDVLVGAGFPASRISVNAHGESPVAEQSADSFALERRVSLTLYVGETPAFAANPR
jgi:outer membrane protein OmpA-like peptidoglycan-associated protein